MKTGILPSGSTIMKSAIIALIKSTMKSTVEIPTFSTTYLTYSDKNMTGRKFRKQRNSIYDAK